MSIYVPGKLVLRKTYIPPFPESPADNDQWTDINTGKLWEYDLATDTWSDVTP